jgi:glycosyltransferase involved in cell wall biosynthesis
LIPKIANNSLHIFTVSEFSKKDIIENLKIDSQKITVVYNAVSNRFRYLGLKRKNIILSVATLQSYKNMQGLIKAFLFLKEKYKNMREYKLILVGGINQKVFRKTKFRELVNDRRDIIFTGYMSDKELIELYNEAKLFVLVSKFEGFGIPPLEAMACRCPVVVSNVTSLPEVCGDAAYYVNPYSIEDIANGIYKVLVDENLRENLILRGIERSVLFWKGWL